MIIILGSFAPHAESEPREHKNLKKYDGNKVQGIQKILPDEEVEKFFWSQGILQKRWNPK